MLFSTNTSAIKTCNFSACEKFSVANSLQAIVIPSFASATEQFFVAVSRFNINDMIVF
jgi:hypothetical protein